MTLSSAQFAQELASLSPLRHVGKVVALKGMLVEAEGLVQVTAIGDKCTLINKNREQIQLEVVGFKQATTLLMPYSELQGVGLGCDIVTNMNTAVVYPHKGWLGRVLNCHGEPIDGKGPLPRGDTPFPIKAPPPAAHSRHRVAGKLDLGVRALNTFLTTCRGQRMGIFSGSGVGKSMLLAMLTRYAATDVKVIGLIGERGREVQEFIEDYLGPEGLAQAVVVVSTSDEMALCRRQATYLTMAIAEFFRDQSLQVLCMLDSITRFAMAQREIGLATGEPPTTKGYTPTVFAELPKLLERAGPGSGNSGDITAFFSVLVEGDDFNEPVADTVRGIIDGHIVLDRAIAERGRFPAINILKSISRMLPGCNNEEENGLIHKARNFLSTYQDMYDMVRIGAYKPGTNAEVDSALYFAPLIEKFLEQKPAESSTLEAGYAALKDILNPQAK